MEAAEAIREAEGAAMPPIQTLEQAPNRADQFIARYYVFKRLVSVRQESGSWRLVYDVNILPPAQRVEITLDAATGEVTGYGPAEQ